jgi:hypothetical protein
MLTVAKLRKHLAAFPDDAKCYAYSGEDTGVVIVDHGFIPCSEGRSVKDEKPTEFDNAEKYAVFLMASETEFGGIFGPSTDLVAMKDYTPLESEFGGKPVVIVRLLDKYGFGESSHEELFVWNWTTSEWSPRTKRRCLKKVDPVIREKSFAGDGPDDEGSH